MDQFVGIDLGTTNSCVGIWKNGRVDIVPNDEDSKRMIGKKLNDPSIKQLEKQWPFMLEPDKNGKPQINVPAKNENGRSLVKPEEISALVLKKMMQLGAKPFGNAQNEIRRGVLAYPANFDANQRAALLHIAKSAGFEIIRIISEPTAAAMAYGFYHGKYTGYNILVYDFGGGTFDVTIIRAKNGEFSQLVTLGDAALGGRDLDAKLFELCVEKVKNQTGHDLKKNTKLVTYLQSEITNWKERLTAEEKIENELPYLDFVLELSREEFEASCESLLKKTLKITKDAIDEANLAKEDIDIVLLIGGSTFMPKVHEMLVEEFGERVIDQKINPDWAVANGCTVVAAQETGTMKFPKLSLVEILPLSIGIELEDGRMCRLIERGTKIPCKRKDCFRTSHNDQQGMEFVIRQGESPLASENIKISQLTWGEKEGVILVGPVESQNVELEISVDRNGMVNYRAWKADCEARGKIGLLNGTAMGSQKVHKMLAKAREKAAEENAEYDRLEAKNELKMRILELEYSMKNSKRQAEKEELQKLHQNFDGWLKKNGNAKKNEFHGKLTELLGKSAFRQSKVQKQKSTVTTTCKSSRNNKK